jgi:alpha(1,3/1,4) fucosyltransferase
MKKNLKLGMVDFACNWGPWPNPIDYFVSVLSPEYDVEIVVSDFIGHRFDTGKKPDLVICTIPGGNHLKYDCPRVLWPVEPRHPSYDGYSACMTWDFDDDPRHYRLPACVLYGDLEQLTKPKQDFDKLWDRKFCCVLLGKQYPSNQTPREDFFRKLCEYKKVDSAGRYLNNMGLHVPGAVTVHGYDAQSGPYKIDLLRQYKFALAFENAEWPGYTSEKLTDAMFANCIPIHWGNSLVDRDFNTKSFVACHEYENLDKVIDRIIQLDTDKEAYRSVIEQPYCKHNTIPGFAKKENLLRFFQKVLG